MTRICERCSRVYDDAECWTICPHMPLFTAHEPYHPETNPGGYCPDHDLVGPHIHEEA